MIEECLKKVCVGIREYLPIWGNIEWFAGQPVQVTNGQYPVVSFGDSVEPFEGYTYSEGWIKWSSSIQIDDPTVVLAFGVYISGPVCWYDVDGDGHVVRDDEWGRVKVRSRFKVRSIIPGGAMSNLHNSRNTEVNDTNDSGHTSPKPWFPRIRHFGLNYSVNKDHIFILDYTLSYELERSNDDNSGAYVSARDLLIRPYIVTQTCHNEWERVRDDIKTLSFSDQPQLVLEEDLRLWEVLTDIKLEKD